jgi:glycosyltransferase involved in cell wall biosynthesis
MLIKRKGVDLLIKALSQVKQRGVEFRCNIIGNGIYRQELESLAQALNLQNEVIFRGALPNAEVRTLLNSCDILVAPGNLEPWGVPVNEAIQSGLPVVVSDSVLGGSDLVRVSGAGQVFAAGNADSLAASLLKLMSDPAALPQAKEKARTYAWRISPEVAAEYLKNVVLYSLGERSERPSAPWLQSDQMNG